MNHSTLKFTLIALSAIILTDCTNGSKSGQAGETQKDSVQQTVIEPEPVPGIEPVPKEELKFLSDAADARMMDIEEGKQARIKSTNQAIVKYGDKMIKDQTVMLTSLREVAGALQITLPKTISKEKRDGLKDLKGCPRAKFDKKFTKMMTIDHQRDLKLFKKASEFKNKEIREFAATYVTMIEGHLEKIKAIGSATHKK